VTIKPRLPLLGSLLALRQSLSIKRRSASSSSSSAPSSTTCFSAPVGAAGLQQAAADAAADAATQQLDNAHLAAFLARHSLAPSEATLIPRDSLTPDEERDRVVKSIILSAKQDKSAAASPVLVVARLADRVDERAVAAQLGVSRRAVRLATASEALASSGFVVGTVPPVGHRAPLRTLVDEAVVRLAEEEEGDAGAFVFGGGGRDGVEMRLTVAALLRLSRAEVGRFAKPSGGSGTVMTTSGGSISSTDSDGDELAAPAATITNASSFSFAEDEESGVVRLVARVASRRRVARLLMFATLVPADQQGGSSELPPRPRAWRTPTLDDDAVELQLIAGKTLERALGADRLAQLLASVRPGCVVEITGRVQQQAGASSTLDVVASMLEVVVSAEEAAAVVTEAAAAAVPAEAADEEEEEEEEEEEDEDDDIDARYYRLPFDGNYNDRVVLVTDVAGVELCARALDEAEREQQHRWHEERGEGALEANGDDDAPRLGSRFLLSPRAAVVGIDAEWPPYGTNSSSNSNGPDESDGTTHPPVELLQIALRERVFLLDLRALLLPPPPSPSPLTPAERAVDSLLTHLLASPWLIKAGLGLAHDLRRLSASYPRLPCFRPAPTPSAATEQLLPLRSHVDLPLLARATLPTPPPGPVPSLSRLCEAALGLPLDKRQQRSAWSRRPLSPAQIRYASADAHVLTALFDALVSRAAFLRGTGAEEGKDGNYDDSAVRNLDGGLRRVPRAKEEQEPLIKRRKERRRR
jgi:prolyl-tRNA editing enzyme YbaK/EbsC (Cys-tRNA(Pro) deacylase)